MRVGGRSQTVLYRGHLYRLVPPDQVRRPKTAVKPIGFYKDGERRTRPITPRSGHVKGAVVSHRYRPKLMQVQRSKSKTTLENPMLYRNLMVKIQRDVDADSFDKVDWESEVDLKLEPNEAYTVLKEKYPEAFKEKENIPSKREQKAIIKEHQTADKMYEEAKEAGFIKAEPKMTRKFDEAKMVDVRGLHGRLLYTGRLLGFGEKDIGWTHKELAPAFFIEVTEDHRGEEFKKKGGSYEGVTMALSEREHFYYTESSTQPFKPDTHKVKIERKEEGRKPSMLKGETLDGSIERGRVRPIDVYRERFADVG